MIQARKRERSSWGSESGGGFAGIDAVLSAEGGLRHTLICRKPIRIMDPRIHNPSSTRENGL
jgi:hypothetical protein